MNTDTKNQLLDQVLDANLWAKSGIPHAALGQLRENHPVARYEGDVVDPFWLVTRHADIVAISAQPEQWLNAPRTILLNKRGVPNNIHSLPQMDGAQHVLHRKAIQAWFTPQQIQALADRAKVVARELVDEMAKKNHGDLVPELATPHPLWMMCEILGIPQSESDQVHRLAKSLFAPVDTQAGDDYAMSVQEVFDYCKHVVERLRENPGDDLVSAILRIEEDGAPIGEFEVLSHLLVMISAGHDTTASVIAGGMLALLQNPDQLAVLQQDPTLMPKAIEEMVRWVTPTTNFMRTAAQETVINGVTIPAGDDVCLYYAAANRDALVYDNGDEFRVDRRPNRHLGFGTGAHLCVGQMLAKSELRAVFGELIPRIKRIELAGDPEWMNAFWISALKTLPVSYEISQ